MDHYSDFSYYRSLLYYGKSFKKSRKNKNKLRTIYPKNHENFKNSNLGSNFTGSCKKRVLESRALQEELDLFDEYGVDELNKQLSHYGDDKCDICNSDESRQKADLNAAVVWSSFIRMMFQHRILYQCSIEFRLTNQND